MNELDRRAAEAATALRSEVAVDLDVDAAYDEVLAGGGRRRTTASTRRGALLAAAVVAVVVGLAVLVVQAPGIDDGSTDEMSADGELSAAGAAILNGLPDGPLDGRESWRLPVVAAPQDGLHEGDEVTLYGRGFEPGELVGAVHCGSEADTGSAGVGACDLGSAPGSFDNTVSTSARRDGTVVVTVTLRRHITTPAGRIDCASAAERCLLAIGAADNYDRSGGTYVNFADAPPFPTPSFELDPAGPYTPGQEVTARATGLLPGRPAQILQCVGEDLCVSLSQGRVAADGTYAATVVVGSALSVDGDESGCADACTMRLTGIGLADATSAPMPEPIPLELLPGEAVVGAAPPSTAPPSTEMPPVGPTTTIVDGPTTTIDGGPTITDTVPPSTAPPASATTEPASPSTTVVEPPTTTTG